MKRQGIIHFTMPALFALLLVSAAQADSVGVTLTQSSMSGAPGSTLTFDASTTNLSSTDTIFLNGDSSTTSSVFLTVDDTPFLTNFPLSLNPSQESGPFPLFNVFLEPTIPAGTYDLNSFSILGGLDGNASNTIGTADFSVTVSNTTAVPEPGMLVLLLSGLLGIGVFTRFRRIGGTT